MPHQEEKTKPWTCEQCGAIWFRFETCIVCEIQDMLRDK